MECRTFRFFLTSGLLLLFALAAVPCPAGEQLDILDYGAVRNAAPGDLQSARPLAEKAAVAYERGDLKRAEELFTRALRRAVHPRWYFVLGQVMFARGRYVESRKAYVLAALFGFHRQGLAYYRAARSAAADGSEQRSLTYLETALQAGFSPRSRLLQDETLRPLHTQKTFWFLLDSYFPPSSLQGSGAALNEVPADYRDSVRVDMNGNGERERVVLFRFNPVAAGGEGSYYFALYRREGGQLRLVNRTVSRLRSLPPAGGRADACSGMKPGAESRTEGSFISVDLDGEPGRELVVPAVRGSCCCAKVLDWRAGRLDELGEVAGFTGLHRAGGKVLLLSRPEGAQRDACGGGQDAAYVLEGGKLKQAELPGELR